MSDFSMDDFDFSDIDGLADLVDDFSTEAEEATPEEKPAPKTRAKKTKEVAADPPIAISSPPTRSEVTGVKDVNVDLSTGEPPEVIEVSIIVPAHLLGPLYTKVGELIRGN